MTDFDLTIETIRPIFETHGFKIVDSYKNFAKFESKSATVTISYDERENSNSIFVGELNGDLNLLHKENIRDVFQCDTEQIEGKEISKFLRDFLSNEGKGILTGDLNKLRELDKYEKERSKIYTDDLIRRQNIRHADQAWDEKNYLTFIKHVDLLDKDSLPKSYTLKYKMAWDKIQGRN